jgi:hypothetical protein
MATIPFFQNANQEGLDLQPRSGEVFVLQNRER